MFSKFDKTQIGNSTAIKSSVQRAIRQKLLDQFEGLRENDGALLEQIWPKKESISLIKCHNQLQLLSFNGFPLFFQSHDDPYVPTLRLLHLCRFDGSVENLSLINICRSSPSSTSDR